MRVLRSARIDGRCRAAGAGLSRLMALATDQPYPPVAVLRAITGLR